MEHTNPAPTPSTPATPATSDEPALHRAARLGDHDEIRRLVALSHDVNAIFNLARDERYDEEATPLTVAAGSGDGASAETVRLLLELGAKTDIGDNLRPIIAACVGLGKPRTPGGDAPRLRVLLEHGASLPSTPRDRNELLCETAAVGDPARVQLLLEHGCDPRGYFDAKEAEEEYRRRDARDEAFWTARLNEPNSNAALFLAELRREKTEWEIQRAEEEFQLFVAGPHTLDIPLHRAAGSGSAECIRLLVDAGADPLARSNDRQTAMHSVSSGAAAKLLLELGLSLDDEDDLGSTPMRNALWGGEMKLERVKALVEAGADLHKRYKYGLTIFHTAVGSGRTMEVLRFLVASGADALATTDFGSCALHCAIDTNGESRDESSIRETFTYLCELGVDVDHPNSNNWRPLDEAIFRGVPVEVRVLCELGANPNAMSPLRSWTSLRTPDAVLPLIFSAFEGRSSIPKLAILLEFGADPLYRDSNGHTLLMHVASILSRDRAAYVELMNGFLAGLPGIDLGEAMNARTRDEFITHAVPPIRGYVDAFASRVMESPMHRDEAKDPAEPEEPPDERSLRWERKRREERTECLVILATYSAWAQLAGGNVRERPSPRADGSREPRPRPSGQSSG